MIRFAISKGIRFDYILTDSWFTYFELIKFIVTRHVGCHFIGIGKTRYKTFGKNLTNKKNNRVYIS